MAFDAFLIFAGHTEGGAVPIKGESQDVTMKDKAAFEIDSFQFGVENTLNIGSKSGGAGAGKAMFKEFTVEKATDSGSPGLFQTCCCGGHYNDVELVLRRSGGDSTKSGTEFLKYQFQVVAVKSIDWQGSDGDDVPKETVTFEFGAIRITYTPQDKTGKPGTAITHQWDRVANQAVFPT